MPSNRDRGFSITLAARLKHGGLRRAVKKLGSQSALARHLGVRPDVIGRWCNMKDCPPTCPEEITVARKRSWPPGRLEEIEKKLFDLTGETLADLFPPELRNNREFLDSPKQIEETRTFELLQITSAFEDRMLLPSPERGLEQAELRDDIAQVLKSLSYREREIIKLRYGIGGDGTTYTLEEVGHIFKVTREVIRQIEAKAVRKLQQPGRAQKLVGHLPMEGTP